MSDPSFQNVSQGVEQLGWLVSRTVPVQVKMVVVVVVVVYFPEMVGSKMF